ncbi:MAG: TFIIB-type zinc finger domain-containing protein [Butyrivibrio sp.]|nr:TFIIB-type zinc finger domain-containing protein [Butyrivibrio sp.]
MKQLTCEMCGGTDLVKQDGLFVCQTCGTKYSVEEAKKMMIEGTVDVTGTVKVDNTDEIQNLYELARRAKNDNNSENAQKYYEKILIKDPSSWEANFYSTYYQSMNCKVGQIGNAAIMISNCEDTVLELIKNNVSDDAERRKAVDEVAGRLISIANLLFSAAKNHYDGIGYQIQADYTQEMLNNCCSARNICYNFGNNVINYFGDEYGKSIAVPCWKTGIMMHNALIKYFAQKEANKTIIMEYADKIKKYDSSYDAPYINTTSSASGCYVATAVYGSYDCPQVWVLRRYRDFDLAETWFGRVFIRVYYTISPSLVKWFGQTRWFKAMCRGILNRMVEKLEKRGYEAIPYKDREW